jgi:hypothetical protein
MVLYKGVNFFVSIRNQRWLPPHSNLTYDPLEKEFQNDSYLRSQNHLNMCGFCVDGKSKMAATAKQNGHKRANTYLKPDEGCRVL